MRLWRAVRWYQALRREPFGLSRFTHVRIAWYWSSDKAAYDEARRRRPTPDER